MWDARVPTSRRASPRRSARPEPPPRPRPRKPKPSPPPRPNNCARSRTSPMAPPSCRPSPTSCRRPSGSCVGRTGTARLLPAAAALLLLGCGGDTSGPVFATTRLDYVDGAIEPILTRGQKVVLEGFGFGAARGSGAVRFTRSGGGETEASVPDSAWSALSITTTVPDSAASGTLTVVTSAGSHLTATVHVLPAPAFDPVALSWE